MAEEVAAAKADQDNELLQIAQALLQVFQSEPVHNQPIQTANSSYIIRTDRGSQISVQIGTPPSP